MISVCDLCGVRKIEKLDISTPILIPSLSSKGFPNIQQIVSSLSEYLTDVTMVSSYDVRHDHISVNQIRPNILFIDSGGFEARVERDFADEYLGDYQPLSWTRDEHAETASKLNTLSSLVFVSFDQPDNSVALSTQLTHARELFAKFPESASDFLVKPYLAPYIDVPEVIGAISELAVVDILGFTEKELGASLVDRLLAIVQIRQALTGAGLALPIHVFGCLDPMTVQLFFLCGADIFDGLSWLRFGYFNSVAVYRNNWIALTGDPKTSYEESRWLSWIDNLATLSQLKKRLTRFAETFDPSLFAEDASILDRVLSAANVTII